jgi:mono/diheme cytochrome c family protein
MYGMIRYSLTIAASICVVMLAGERAFGQPRIIREAPNGDLFVADSRIDAVRVLRVSPRRATPLRDEVFARGLKHPLGIAFYPLGSNPRWIYIASSSGLVRLRYRNGDLEATSKPEQITAGIPTIHQYARGVAFSPDGHRLYFSLGSARTQVVATGLWTCQGMTVQPAAGELSCIVDEHDELSDNTPQSAPLQMGVYQGDHSSRAYTRTAAVASESVRMGDDAARSRDLYLANCAACHQAGGEGLPGVFPPLKGSGVVNKDDASKHIQVVLNGMQGGRAGGVVYAAPMPPFADTLSDAQIASIIDYERSSWGNHGTPVTAAQVAAARAPPK